MFDRLQPRRSGAGRSAAARYAALRAPWWARVRTRIIAVLTGAAAVALALLWWLPSDLRAFALGAAAGALLAIYAWARDSPPPYIECWRIGSEGERKTARVLAPLRNQGAVFHDLADHPLPDGTVCGNLDHLVVVAAGIYLIDTKWLAGTVSVAGEALEVARRDWPEQGYTIPDPFGTMRARAASLRRDVGDINGRAAYVTPVIAFWDAFQGPPITAHGVELMNAADLADWLGQQPARWSGDEVTAIAERITTMRSPRATFPPIPERVSSGEAAAPA